MKKGFVIPVREKLAYGVGDCAINIAYGSMGFYMLWFMVNVGGISPARAGIIFAAARIWDAAADYLFGRISDRTRHRLGRRRPFIIFGCIPLGISFVFLWFVPFKASAFDPSTVEWLRFCYYLVVYIIFETAFAAVAIPYGSLMPEMTQNYDERSVLSGFRLGSSFVGTLLGAAGVMFITDILLKDTPRVWSFFFMSIVFGVIMIGLLLITGAFSKERVSETQHVQDNPLTAIRSFFAMKEFRIVVGMFVFNMIGIDIIMSMIAFYMKDAIGVSDDIAFVFMAVPLLTALFFSPFWVFASEKLGKKNAYIGSAVFMTAVLAACVFVPKGNIPAVAVCTILVGIGMSAAQIIPWSIMPDIVEIDESRNGVRREGEYYGIMIFLYKVLSGLSVMAVGQMIGLFGYVERSQIDSVAASQVIMQPDSAVMAVRVMIGFVPGVFFLISALYIFFLPVTKEKFNEILRALKERKGEVG